MARVFVPHSSHWGAFEAEVADGTVVAIRPYRHDPDPSPLLGNIVDSLRHRARITQPMIRAGWLDRGPGPDARRGAEPFVPVSWTTAIDLLASELRRVYDRYGGEGVYGGSYGWSSAGRFHHAQSQLHRFLNCLGGYVRGEHTYSNGAQSVIMPHVVGSMREFLDRATAWSVLERHTELFVCFGGIPIKNTMVSPGGASRHPARDHLHAARARGAEFVLLSPLRDDLPGFVSAEWLAIVPGTDVAVMLALAHTLVTEDLARPRVPRPLLRRLRALRAPTCSARPTAARRRPSGPSGSPRSRPRRIRALARRMAARRTLINVNYSLQRVEHGEQAPWLAVTLAAMLGQIGLPGGGFGQGYGSLGYIGRAPLRVGPPTLPQGRQSRERVHPVRARGGHAASSRASRSTSTASASPTPTIRLVYWCGGNPFHHHQDLARLRRALARPRDDRRARLVLDADGAPRRRRAAGDDDARAQRHRRLAERRVPDRHAPGGRAVGPGPERLCDPRRPREGAGDRASRSPRAGTRWRGCATCTKGGDRGSRTTAMPRRRSTNSGRPASSS